MIRFRYLLLEDLDYDAAEDFHERHSQQLCDLATLLKKSNGKGRVPWKTIPASLLKKVWFQFGKYQKINENDLDKIADQILTNIARLQASTEMMGHESYDVRPDIEDYCGITFTDEEWDSWMSNYFTNKQGGWMLSDYGLKPLQKLYGVIFNATTPEEKLYACDKALNVVHQRSDLASMFVEGGSSTLNIIANQGGYSHPGEYGSVNREFWEQVNKRESLKYDDYRYWWMNPKLQFHGVPREGHARFAVDYIQDNNIPQTTDPYSVMYKLGWVRVGLAPYQGKIILAYNYNPAKPLSDKQLRALNDFAKEQGADEMRDNAKGIWRFID